MEEMIQLKAEFIHLFDPEDARHMNITDSAKERYVLSHPLYDLHI